MTYDSTTQTLSPHAGRGLSLGSVRHAVPWLLMAVVYFFFPTQLSLGFHALIMMIFALSLYLVLGCAGIVTMGHALFFGIGAYAAGLFAMHVSQDPILGLLAGTAIAGVAALVIGFLILHTNGLALLVLTLSFASLAGELANYFSGITGGDDGLQGYGVNPIFGMFRFDLWGRTAYIYAAVVLFIWFVITWIFAHSPFGKSVFGIHRNRVRMAAIGTPIRTRLVLTYTLGGAMAGSAGAIAAQTTGVVGLDSFGLLMSGTVIVMLILGGYQSIYGAFVGVAVYSYIHDVASQIDPYYWMLVIGVLLIASVFFFDKGLTSIGEKFGALTRRTDRKETTHE